MKKTIITIDTTRSGYSIQQILDGYETIRVGELKEILKQYDDDTPIIFKNDEDFTYGHVYDRFIGSEGVDVTPEVQPGDKYRISGFADEIISECEYQGRVDSKVEILDEPDESGWVLCRIYILGDESNVEAFVDVDALMEI